MNILRRLGLSLSALVFSLSIFLFAAFVSIYYVLDTPKQIETALQKSGIYNVAAPSVVEQTRKDNPSSEALPLDNAGVQNAIQKAISPSVLQNNTEKALNSIYAWVHGETTTPDFKIDLSQQKEAVANNLANYLKEKLSNLPACPAGTPVPQTADDVLAATCRPAAVSVDALAAKVQQQAQNEGIVKDSTFTADSLKDQQGRPLFDKLSYIPKAHHYFIISLFALPGLIVITAALLIFGSARRRHGLRRVSVTLLTTGIYSIVIAIAAMWMISYFAGQLPAHSSADQATLVDKIIIIIKTLVGELRMWWLGFGIAYLGLGIAGLLTAKYKSGRTGGITQPDKNDTPDEPHPLGHNLDIPRAGTTFTHTSNMPASAPHHDNEQHPEPPKTKQQ